MKRRGVAALLGLLLALCLLAGCSGNPLPEGMEEAAVLDAGRAVVTLLNEGDYQAVYDQMRADGQEGTSVEEIAAYMQAVLDEAGAYVKETDSLATGQTIKDTGEDYATAVLYCKHQEDDVMYRIAFSADMELMGFQAAKQ